MRTNDILNREEVRGLLQKAIKDGDSEGFYAAFDQMLQCLLSTRLVDTHRPTRKLLRQ